MVLIDQHCFQKQFTDQHCVVNRELDGGENFAEFLHEYMVNKDKTEF